MTLLRLGRFISILSISAGASHALAQSAQFIPIPGAFGIPGRNDNFCGVSGTNGYSGVRVSADGQVVVTVVYIPGFSTSYVPSLAARWTESTGTTVISPPLESLYPATGISRDGSTIYGPDWVWTSASGYSSLSSRLGNTRQIFGCSDDASVVTGIEGTYPFPGDLFLWNPLTPNTPPRTLPRAAAFPEGYFYFNSISGDGRVVGAAARLINTDSSGSDRYAAAVVTTQGVQLITPTGQQAGTNDLNFDGTIAVGNYTDGGSVRAFSWSESTGLIQLDLNVTRSSGSFARAISGDGQVIVGDYFRFGFGGTDAFVYRESTGFVDLREDLAFTYNLDAQLQGWRFLTATDVSGDGQVIVGQGINPEGCEQAFVVKFFGPVCAADFNLDGGIDGADVEAFFALWSESEPAADINQDGGVDGSDIEPFFTLWEAGC